MGALRAGPNNTGIRRNSQLQQLAGPEVIVVDDPFSHGYPRDRLKMVEAEFAERSRVIRRLQDSPIAGRNQGFNAASGVYILCSITTRWYIDYAIENAPSYDMQTRYMQTGSIWLFLHATGLRSGIDFRKST
jgi:hypothetical protein